LLYLGAFTQFFMEVKNDRCAVCGATTDLTRHHIVPKRHKRKLPQPWRSCLSNVLFVCSTCHRKYEESPEPDVILTADWQAYARAWKSHFLTVLNPQFIPAGWDIISVRNFAAIEQRKLRADHCKTNEEEYNSATSSNGMESA
jgi:hypothetical protein